MDAYISKVTSQGQVTLPKKVRENLGLSGEDYIEFDSIGNAIVVRKLQLKNAELERIRTKIKKSGISAKKVREIVEESSAKVWSETYGKVIPRR